MLLQAIFQIGNTYVEAAPPTFLDYISKLSPVLLGIGTIIISIISLRASRTSVRTSQASLNLSARIAENFDAKKIFIKGQIETVLEFIKKLNTLYLHAVAPKYDKNIPDPGSISTFFGFDTLSEDAVDIKSGHPDYSNRQLSVSHEFLREYRLLTDAAKNVFMPDEIRMEIEKLRAIFKSKEELNNQWHYVFVTLNDNILTKHEPEFVLLTALHYPVYADLFSFLRQIVEIKKAVNTWLIKYDIKANIKTRVRE